MYCLGKAEMVGFQSFAHVDPLYKTPSVAVCGFALFGLLLSLISGFGGELYFKLPSSQQGLAASSSTTGAWYGFSFQGYFGTLFVLLVYILTQPSLFSFFRKERPSHFSLFFHVFLPSLTLLFYLIPLFGNLIQVSFPYDYLSFAALGWLLLLFSFIVYLWIFRSSVFASIHTYFLEHRSSEIEI
jgi:hypothetical protein